MWPLEIGANTHRAPLRCPVLVDGMWLTAGTALVLAPTLLRVLTVEHDGRQQPPINLLSEDEGKSWCRGWDGDAARALHAAVLLR